MATIESFVVLCIEDDILYYLYQLNIKIYLGLNTVRLNTATEVIDHITQFDDICLIVSQVNNEQEDMGSSIYDYLYKLDIKIPIVLLGETHKEFPENIINKDKNNIKKSIQLCASHLGITAKLMADIKSMDYYPIPWPLIKSINQNICDVYLRHLDDNLKFNYKKYVAKYDCLSSVQVDELKRYGQLDLYIKGDDRFKFANFYNEIMYTKLTNPQNTYQEQITATSESHNFIINTVQKYGINDEAVHLAEQCISSIIMISKNTKSLKDLLKHLLSDKSSLRYKHCQLVSYICIHILKHMRWAKNVHYFKLSFVAFFHDICLKEDRFITIHSTEELEKLRLPMEEYQVVMRHALEASHLVSRIKKAPLEADKIIREHHGKNSGVGFAEQAIGHDEMTTIFMVAETLVNYSIECFNNNVEITMNDMMAYLNNHYQKNIFKVNDIINIFKQSSLL